MYRLCQHTMTSGLRCKSPALRTDDFCYFHTAFRRQQRELAAEAQRPTEFIAPNFNSRGDFIGMAPVKPRDIEMTRGVIRKPLDVDLGLLEDTASIQLAISNVLAALAHGRLETRRASVLLYGLQLASNNCRQTVSQLDPMKSGIYDPTGEGEGPSTQPAKSTSSHPESSKNYVAPDHPAQYAEESPDPCSTPDVKNQESDHQTAPSSSDPPTNPQAQLHHHQKSQTKSDDPETPNAANRDRDLLCRNQPSLPSTSVPTSESRSDYPGGPHWCTEDDVQSRSKTEPSLAYSTQP